MNNTEFTNLRAHIKATLDSTTLSDPHDVAALVLKDSTAAQRKEWVEEILPAYVADVMRDGRNRSLNHAMGRRTPTKSAKVAGVRDWWSKLLDSRISVGEQWKPVGDCTAEDLALVIEARRQKARQINAQADKYEVLLGLLARHNASTIRELPSDAVLFAGIEGLAA